jgi:ubiquinone/menaquinone biosynthesis C-methylase UbiE
MKGKGDVIQYYSDISKSYERIRLGSIQSKMISDFQINWFVKNLENVDPVCLEVGCGTGRITRVILEKAQYLVALDGSIEMIKINKDLMRLNQRGSRVEYVLCDASHLPFRGECFGSVLGARTFWHILSYSEALAEALRVVKSNNSVLFDFPSLWGTFSLYSRFFRTKHDVLTEFTNRETIQLILRKSRCIVIEGNTSCLLFFAPDKILKRKVLRKLISQFERLGYGWLKDLFSYYLIKCTK